MVHCVASANMLAAAGGMWFYCICFPDADLFMTHAAVSLIHTPLFLLGEYTVKYYLN